jgi:ligand-binding sensor domain-containing protein/signal transduction histidine kinase
LKPLLILFIFLFIACERENERPASFEFKRPTVVEAVEYTIPPDKVSPPVIILASTPTKRLLGKPEIVQLASNEFPATVTATIPAGYPKLVIPNGKYESPRVVRAVDSPYAAKPPEIITMQSTNFSENNRGMFSVIKAKDGLHSDEISSLMQDKNGNLWIGEWWGGGISRYDGRFLWNYTIRQGLTSDVVNCTYEDSKGNIWIATFDNGVSRFDGKYFTHYSVKEGLQNNLVHCILEDKAGNMWFGTGNGLTRFDGRLFAHFTTAQGLPTNIVRSLMQDRAGQLWVGADGGLLRFDGHSFHNHTTALHLDERTEIPSLMEDSDGNIWFAANIGLFKYEGDQIKHYTTEGGLSSNSVTKIIQENNGDIWVGTRGGGVNRFDGKSFVHYGPEQGLPNDRVTSIAQDKWGNIWLGTTGGVCKYEGKMFTHVIPIKEEEIEALLTDSHGNIWMGSGTDSCLNRYDGKHMMRYTTETGLMNTEFNYLFQDRHGDIWFATWNGVDKYDGKYLTHYSTDNGLIDNVVFCMSQDKYGNFWFGTNKGLSKFDGKYFTNYSVAQGLCSETIFAILEDHSGNIWIGTNDKGICRFDGNAFTHFPTRNSLTHPMVVGMIEDRNNNIWICTAHGVNKFDGKHFTWYTTEQGLTNNIAKDVVEDLNGNIWIGTLNGLNKYISTTKASDTFKNDAPSYFRNYTIADGFSGGGTYENSMYMDKWGSIWIGSNDRLTLYHPEGDIRDTNAPVLKLTGITLFGEKINWQDVLRKKRSSFTLHNGKQLGKINFSGLSRWYNQPENLQLAYNNNFITFQFIGITTNRPKEVRYRYRLEGFDESWTSTAEPVAVYNKLPPGKFNFRVQSVNSEGYLSNELKYSFVIFPPWWQTTLAYFTYALILSGMIWMFSWYRSRRLKAENIRLEEKVTKRTNELRESLEERYRLSEQIKSQQALLNERLRISRDLHDEIGSTLGSISIYSEVAKKRSEKNENPVTVLSKIGTASRELIEKMSDIVWSLNLNNENFEQLRHRMRAFATMILAPRNIRFDINDDENSKRIQLTNAQTKNIFLIYKEALYNIVKYADCNSVHIHFNAGENELVMTIQDNGKGFNQFSTTETVPVDERLGGNGIKNMYVRSHEIQGNLTVDSQINTGTTIKLTIPV